ncbi:MAG: DNA recombination protein RmuC [Ilumatobacteraceae bacterium]|jgi:DNA recombination protein RmuC
MDSILLVILTVMTLVLLARVLMLTRNLGATKSPDQVGPSIGEIAAKVQIATQESLNSALKTISEQARQDREESIRIATDNIAKSGGEQLGTRAQLIDNTLKSVADQMTKRLDDLSTELNRLRETNNTQYTNVEKAVEALSQRTDNLNEVLSNSQKRGQWGERVVEDMLRAAGFIENINYSKQERNETGGKPDYKLMMPPNRVLFMDVKFPLDQYALHFQASNDQLRAQAKTEFVKAVKGHVDALAKRDYVNNAKEEALDYVLMFLPNESISGFVHEADPTLIDYALSKKVVLCSPLTLYAFLVVVRQATDSFHTEQTAASIMQQINKFNGEWDKYVKAVDDVKATFDKFSEKLEDISTGGTRFNKLAVPVRAIEKMRKKQGIPELGDDTSGELELGDE